MYIALYFIFLIIFVPSRWRHYFLLYFPLALSFELFLPLKDLWNYWPRIITLTIVVITFYLDPISSLKANITKPLKYSSIYLVIITFTLSLFNSTAFELSSNLVIHFIFCLFFYKIYADYIGRSENPDLVLRKLLKITFLAAFLWPIYLGLCSIFKYGRFQEEYGTSFIYYGHAGFYTLYLWMYLMIAVLYFIIKPLTFRRYIGFGVFFATILIILFIAKRTYLYAILSMTTITFLYYFFKTRNVGRLTFILTIFTTISLYVIIPYAGNYFIKTRQMSLERSYFEEGRFLELVAYYDEIWIGGSLQDKLIGKEVFNSQGKFFNKTRLDFFKYIERDRILHSDYAHVLYGTGIFGSVAYILMLYKIFRNGIRKNQIFSNEDVLIRALFIGLFIALIINGLSDGILYFSNRIIVFVFLGAFTGYLNNNNRISYSHRTHN